MKMQTLKGKVNPLPAIDACSYCGKAGKCNPQRRGNYRRTGTSWHVEASSRKEALEIAAGRDMAAIHHSTYDTEAIAAEEWVTSGELDGEPCDAYVEDD